MTQDTKWRILIVEDVPDLSDSYRFFLERAGYLVEVVDRRSTAIAALKAKFYDIALVDLQLLDDISHKGGLDVLDAINDLRDGTKTFVISATLDVKESVASYRKGIEDFIMKGDIKSKDLTGPIEKAMKGYRRAHFGDFPSLSAYLAAPLPTPIWEGHVEEALGCGYPNLQRILWSSLRSYLPLIRRKDGSASLEMDKANKAVSGVFWSKELGCAIWFSAAGNKRFIEPTEFGAERVEEFHGKNVSALIWKVRVDRDEFLERVGDQPGAPR